MRIYDLIDHTADVGVAIQGTSLREVFEKAAYALFDLQVGLEGVQAIESRTIQVEATDLEDALVRWLQRLLVLMDIENMVFCQFHVTQVHPTGVCATAWGEKLDPTRHELKGQIKAVTYHELEIKETTEGWRAQIIFDV